MQAFSEKALARLLSVTFIVVLAASGAGKQRVQGPLDYVRDVEPFLKKRCAPCHGAVQQMNGLRLDQPEAVLKGGYGGPVVIPGKAQESPLFQRISSNKEGFRMPPAGPQVPPGEVALLQVWIDQGAKTPQASEARAPVPAESPKKSKHWAFQSVVRPEPPAVRNRPWVRNPIDTFVLARLEGEGIRPALEADRVTLIRRLSFDLTGLPPTPGEVDAFLSDNRADAYERLVDRLLASAHFGERWARHWLDAARYADSDGYEKDNARPSAWRYRHWVIGALNRDLPFDQFTIEQIAGDLLPGSTVEQRVATGFHRNTLTNREAGVDRAEARFEQLVDRTNTVGTVWLGLSVRCAQCHDHKFDPISQKEYYQLEAFLHNTEELDLEAPLPGEMGPYLQARPEYYRRRAEILSEVNIPEWQAEWERKLVAAMDNPGKELDWDFQVTQIRAMVDYVDRIVRTPQEQRRQLDADRLTDYFVASPGPDVAKDSGLRQCFREAREKLRELRDGYSALSLAPTMVESPNPVPAHIYLRGNYRAEGLEVQPRTPAILQPMPPDAKPNRLTLAKCLVDRRNPLTARVTVNRFWQEYFGQGLVRTAEDFGTQGARPSHPELLDWLAGEFMESGWSMKHLHKLIVTSAVYRQSSDARPELITRDPNNALLARQARLRLPAELIRDNALAVSGLLSPAIGGKSVRPPQPKGVAELSYSGSVKWEESTGPDRYRRGLYILFQRTVPYPQLVNFDGPDATVTCVRRQRSNTPLQALNLLNDPVFHEAAQALAVRVLREVPEPMERRLDYAVRLCLARYPTSRERERLASHYTKQKELLLAEPESIAQLAPNPLPGIPPLETAAWVALGRVLLNLDEFITRE